MRRLTSIEFAAPALLAALLGYEISYLTYERLATEEIVAHVPSLGLSASY